MQGKFGNSMVNAFDIIVLFIPCFRVLVFGIWSLWLCDFISVFFVLPILHCPFSNVCNFVAKSDKKPEKKIGWIKHRIIFLQLMRDWNIRSEKKCTRKVYIKTQQVYSGYKKRREKQMFSNLYRLTKIKASNLSAIYSESIEPLCILHSQFPTNKTWVVDYLNYCFKNSKKQKNNSTLFHATFECGRYNVKKNWKLNSCPLKIWKNHPQK